MRRLLLAASCLLLLALTAAAWLQLQDDPLLPEARRALGDGRREAPPVGPAALGPPPGRPEPPERPDLDSGREPPL